MSAYGHKETEDGGSTADPAIMGRSNTMKSYVSHGGQDSVNQPNHYDEKEVLSTNAGTRDKHTPAKFTEDFNSTNAGTEVGSDGGVQREYSTLKKKGSVVRKQSLKRSGSRSRRNSVGQFDNENPRSAFFTPVPTNSNPTEILANRFSAWRRILKDFIVYFREVSSSYEAKSKGTSRLYAALNNAVQPEMFLRNGGILETNVVLKEYHKSAMIANEQARQIDTQIISALSGLRNDLSVKIKEIKGLSGDFKNSLEKEREATRRAVAQLGDALSVGDEYPSLIAGKSDPYVIKLGVDRQLRRQLTEENYLHRAYLNLEGSGRELESIVVNEIQKAFESYVKIMRREGMELIDTAERLETQTVGLPGDHEWTSFVERDPNFVDPNLKIRTFDDLEYPGFSHPSVTEVRAGLLERKSKYLKSYTPGWYALSPSHLHEFKTPDRNQDLTPVMSLYLPETTMGSHTPSGSGSHKFMVKGRQTGGMHRGHSWVFRAESHEAMMGFYEDIKKLTETSGAERSAFVASHAAQHSRKESSASQKDNRSSSSENGLDNDEADDVPYSAERSALVGSQASVHEVRPEGGRFPSDLAIDRVSRAGPRSATSGESDRSVIAAAGVVHGHNWKEGDKNEAAPVAGAYEPGAENPTADGGHLSAEDAERPRYHQRSTSAFSYDERHPVTSTLVEDENFTPVGADVPPKVERTMGIDNDESSASPPVRRDSTASWTRKMPSRKPTATYGVDPITGQTDPNAGLYDQSQSAVYSANDRQPSQGFSHQYTANSSDQPTPPLGGTQNLEHEQPFSQAPGTPTFGTQYSQPSQHQPTSAFLPHQNSPYDGTRDGLAGVGAGAVAGIGGLKAYEHYQSKNAEQPPTAEAAAKPTGPSTSNAQPSFLDNGSAALSPAVANNATAGNRSDATIVVPVMREENHLPATSGQQPAYVNTPIAKSNNVLNTITSDNLLNNTTSASNNTTTTPVGRIVPTSAGPPAGIVPTSAGPPASAAVPTSAGPPVGILPTSAGPPAVVRSAKNYGEVTHSPSGSSKGVNSVFPGTSPPVAQRTNSSFTISELHVPGEFPNTPDA